MAHLNLDALRSLVVKPSCAALIDQGRMIGGDPVGHKCGNAATQTILIPVESVYGNFRVCFRVCDQCAAMFKTEPERLEFSMLYAEEEKGK